mgnify:CR=1 FL=1
MKNLLHEDGSSYKANKPYKMTKKSTSGITLIALVITTIFS